MGDAAQGAAGWAQDAGGIVSENTIAEIASKHVSDEKRLCYAPSLGPVTAKHVFSGNIEAKVLRCTLPLGHVGNHKDGACCYSPHYYGRDMSGPSDPEWHRWERCVECGQAWPCDVERIQVLREQS